MPGHADAVDRAWHRGQDRSSTRSAKGGLIDVVPLEASESVLARISTEFAVRIAEPPSPHSDARCILAVALSLDRPHARARLQEIRRQYPATPLVIITSGDGANLERLLGLSADAVVPVDRMGDELGSVVRSLRRRSPLELAASALEMAESLDDVLRAAVLTAVQSVPPIHTVKALAKRVGLSPSRLAERFRPVRLRTGWSCVDLLHAVALWRTIELLPSAGSIKRAWERLGLDPRTARRACMAYLGCTASELPDRADTLERALLEFVERCLGVHGERKD